MEDIIQRQLLGTKKKDIVLPKGYRRVAGIKSVDGAYINTCQDGSVLPTVKMRIQLVDGSVSVNMGAEATIWGCSNRLNLQLYGTYTTINLQYGSYHTYKVTYESLKNRWNDLELAKSGLTINGEKQSLREYPMSISGEIHLFKSGNASVGKPLIVDYYQSYEGDVLARNMVACVREEDNTVGLFDMSGSVCPLSGTPLYINAGSGHFEIVDEVI